MEDLTGKPVSLENIAEAQRAVRNAMIKYIADVPPELAVQLGNIHRCLAEFGALKLREIAGA